MRHVLLLMTILFFRPGLSLGAEVFPNTLQQLECISVSGACRRERDAGLPSAADIAAYDRQCRTTTRYTGPAIAGDRMQEFCAVDKGWERTNRELPARIRAESGMNDAEALARMFADSRWVDGGWEGRLDAILAAMENPDMPGGRTGIEFSDEGFKGDRTYGGAGYRDPHEPSRNQVGHFLTAVGLGFDPSVVRRTKLGFTLRGLLEADPALSDEAVTLRLIVGHEKAPDPEDHDEMLTRYLGFKRQFHEATEADAVMLYDAERAVGSQARLDMAAAEPILRQLPIRYEWRGNSIQDLRLSLIGWVLGRRIRNGAFANGQEVASWLRLNLMESR